MNDLWGRRLERIMEIRDWTQTELAAELRQQVGIKASQSDISQWKRAKVPLPDRVQRYVEQQEEKLNLNEEDLPRERAVHASTFCLTQTTFKRLVKESKKSVGRIVAAATVTKSKGNSSFADISMTMTFVEVDLKSDDSLYLDCMGVIPELVQKGHTYSFDDRKGSRLSWVKRDRKERAGATVDEVKAVQETLGPYALGYELRNVLKEQSIVVEIRGERGVRTDGIDAIGVPVYADCPVQTLSLSVTFEHLKPQMTPKAQVYLLRRTLVASRPLHLKGGLEVEALDEQRHKYSFENLLYPRPGFGYCIAWDSLE